MVTCTIPKAIFGSFFIIVGSDTRNQVYEHTSEDDNTRVSDVSDGDISSSVISLNCAYSVGSALIRSCVCFQTLYQYKL